MLAKESLSQVEKRLTSAQTVFIGLATKPSYDLVAAGLGLFLSLSKQKKKVTISCSTPMKVAFSSLIGVEKIKTDLGEAKDTLIISFDYLADSIEKVSYNIEGGKFNLVVRTKPGFPPLSSEKVSYSYTGGQADLIWVMGASSLNDLGKLYQGNQKFFEKEKMVSFNFLPTEEFAQINLVNSKAASFSEMVVDLIYQLKLPIDEEVATNLLAGIEEGSNHFLSPQVNETTFEAAAFCLRSGAKRRKEGFSSSSVEEETPQSGEEKTEGESPPSDWFGPKIYRGDTRI